MTYKLRFHALAWQEWNRLDGSIKAPLKKKLLERLEEPRIPSSALSGVSDCYKIKLRQAGYRLVYRVDDKVVFVTVIAVGKRDKSAVYAAAGARLNDDESA
jgi:mRNA interferase RelE/StbE